MTTRSDDAARERARLRARKRAVTALRSLADVIEREDIGHGRTPTTTSTTTPTKRTPPPPPERTS